MDVPGEALGLVEEFDVKVEPSLSEQVGWEEEEEVEA